MDDRRHDTQSILTLTSSNNNSEVDIKNLTHLALFDNVICLSSPLLTKIYKSTYDHISSCNYYHKSVMSLTGKGRLSILDKPLSRGKGEVSLSCFALLFSEVVQYCQNHSHTVPQLQIRLHELGKKVGVKLIDLYFVREKNGKREIKLLNILLFIKSTLWKALFGREADKLEHSNDDENTYYLMEKEPIVNRYISVPKDKSSLNCATFIAGIIEAVLTGTGFTAQVTAHWHKGTTYMVKFDDGVVARDKQLEER